MSYKVEITERETDPVWVGNGLRFETSREAACYGIDLLSRWSMPRAYRVVESPDEVNYIFNDTGCHPVGDLL